MNLHVHFYNRHTLDLYIHVLRYISQSPTHPDSLVVIGIVFIYRLTPAVGLLNMT